MIELHAYALARDVYWSSLLSAISGLPFPLFSGHRTRFLQTRYVKALCSKHLFWGMENECRLILNVADATVARYGRNIPFFPARRVYLGVSMADCEKARIAELCSRLPKPPEVLNMVANPDSFYPTFEIHAPTSGGI